MYKFYICVYVGSAIGTGFDINILDIGRSQNFYIGTPLKTHILYFHTIAKLNLATSTTPFRR